ncbi:aldo/keto reductase [Luteimicrobium xylanilyticum]|uniref:D-threo-aldose 1-dehydrogenase n=1 Tax=Luteimicrobium xylanilyticum TaxID=1133546 RepID=A0A5P9Q6X3_9MICO|nr:aldo/keto reductase [Luteimicrobium xylanilyticum]QFU97129.1 D-threo-aldose 1-dehydrogenase [Luteimicrobium xylanilyticum]
MNRDRGLPRRALGRTAVRVTELGFGAAPVGNLYRAVDDAQARDAVDAAWAGGVRYFDTAPHYGLGLSERRLGDALRDRPRDEYVVSTKVGRLLVPNPAPTGSDLASGGFAVPDDLTRARDYSRDGVLRSLDASLERLGLDRVDVVYVHDPEDFMGPAIAEALPALVELREQGVVGAVGAGMNFVDPLRRIVAEADLDVVMVAGRWTLADRSAAPLLDDCAGRGVSVVAAAPFNSGLLARPWPPDDARFDYDTAPDEVLGRARRLASACDAQGTVLPHAAMRFPLRSPAVAAIVAGFGSAAHAASGARWVGEPLSDAQWAAVDRADLNPTPTGGPR